MSTPIGDSPRVPPSASPLPPSLAQRVNSCAQTALGTTTALLSALGEFHFSDQLRASCVQLSSNLRADASHPETVKQVLAVAAQVQQAVQALAGDKNALADVHVATSAATPPFNREPLQALVARWHHSLEALLTQLPLSQLPVDIYIHDPLLLRVIDEVDRDIQTKKTGLSLEAQQEFGAFEKELAEISPLICEYGLRSQWRMDTVRLGLIIKSKADALFGKHPPLKYADLANLDSITESILSLKRVYMRKMDHVYNEVEVRGLIQQQQQQILSRFHPDMINHDDVTFRVEFKAQETHHKGRRPAIVTFESKTSGRTGKVMYKPRDAAIDRDVLQLFQELGPCQVHVEGVSTSVALPHYDILSLGRHSIWQYIEGTDTVWRRQGRRGTTVVSHVPENFIDESSVLNGKDRRSLRVQLQAMENIAAALYLYDLHGENVMLTDQQQLVPIDLECIGFGQPTGLVSSRAFSETLTLTADQQQRIGEFHKRAFGQTTRLVCISTMRLMALCTNRHAGNLANAVMPDIRKGLAGFGYRLTNEENLRIGLYRDYFHGDIPYFSSKGGIAYIGLPEEGLEIAQSC
jgi:hypothetical protein